MKADLEIDAIGLLCPLPVLRLRKRIQALEPGQVACLRADDPAAVVDVPHYCNESGNGFIEMQEADGHMAFYVRKA
ncbi:Sulfurtransferase TusA [Pseudoruegeria aquimaris]|uniref:Sulfurtransferase TusA n=1 Tax=Pseudoruegeria aquimaris TaxID=393663 RepID=A0A1Y5RR04_9RHOB|nr:sulfurtransferase TusA family protein [Pseudoruegeria aquimaris]SLN23287.1 Sulfurtransferase TusA [Pseudoruegeria aquimaris]